MSEQTPDQPAHPPLEVSHEEWLELVNGIRTSPIFSKGYLTETLGYGSDVADTLIAELKDQDVISGEEDKGRYAVIETEEFRRRRNAAGRLAGRLLLPEVAELTFWDKRKVRQRQKFSRNPYSWEELGEPSIPENTTHIALVERAPRLERGETAVERRLRAHEEAILARRSRQLRHDKQGPPEQRGDTTGTDIDWRAHATDPQYLHLFNDSKALQQLHRDIQEEAWPLLEKRFEELNRMHKQQGTPEIALVKDMPPHEKRAIIDPIDHRLTKEYAGKNVPDEVLRAVTLARLFQAGKLHKARPHRKQ